jgi:hypothetical protein
MTRLLLLGFAFVSATAPAAQPASCPQPQMQLEALIVQDDGRDRGYPGGLSLGDVDGDGDLDAYVNAQLKKPNRYFRNQGGGRFVVAELGEATQDKSSNFSSSFADTTAMAISTCTSAGRRWS